MDLLPGSAAKNSHPARGLGGILGAEATRASRGPVPRGPGEGQRTTDRDRRPDLGADGRPAARPLLRHVLRGRARSGRLGGSRRSPRARAGAARAAQEEEGRGRRPPGAGRRLPGPPLLPPEASRSGCLPPTGPVLGPRPCSRGERVPHPRSRPQSEHHRQGRRPTHSPTGGHPPAGLLPAFPSGMV